MAQAGGNSASAADDDRDGLSFFTDALRGLSAPSVFARPGGDPLERVFGDQPLVRDEELGTADLGGTATVEQVLGDVAGLDQPQGSEAWNRAFILYGPPAPGPMTVDHPRGTWLSRLRKHSGVAS